MTDFVEMFRHWNAGRPQVQIHQALNIDRKTIRKYLALALAEGLQPCPAEVFDEELWRARIGRWFPELVDPVVRALTWPQIAAHHQWIEQQLGVPVTVATIAQRLRDDHRVEVSESTVRRYIATTFTEQRLEARVTVSTRPPSGPTRRRRPVRQMLPNARRPRRRARRSHLGATHP